MSWNRKPLRKRKYLFANELAYNIMSDTLLITLAQMIFVIRRDIEKTPTSLYGYKAVSVNLMRATRNQVFDYITILNGSYLQTSRYRTAILF